jgi:prevent-host-death family protein
MSEVGVAQLRRDLKRWLERAQAGDEVVITDRGRPIARMTGIDLPITLQQLIDEGTVSQPRRDRPRARDLHRVRAREPVSAEVIRERETRRR